MRSRLIWQRGIACCCMISLATHRRASKAIQHQETYIRCGLRASSRKWYTNAYVLWNMYLLDTGVTAPIHNTSEKSLFCYHDCNNTRNGFARAHIYGYNCYIVLVTYVWTCILLLILTDLCFEMFRDITCFQLMIFLYTTLRASYLWFCTCVILPLLNMKLSVTRILIYAVDLLCILTYYKGNVMQ